MNELTKRTITAFAIGLVMVGALLNQWVFGFIFLSISVLASFEYIKITKLKAISVSKQWILVFVNAFVFLLGYGIAVEILPNNSRILGILPLFLLFSAGLFGKSSPDYTLSSLLISGHAYIGLPLMVLNYIYLHGNTIWPSFVISILLFVWANDVGAYVIGKWIGKTKLAPRISPNKTWEGLVGGLAFAMLIGFIYHYFSDNLSPAQWIIMAAVAGIGSSFGDLISSSLKRTFDVKDSGSLLPGHGGIIDRFDGFFIAIVFCFAYLSLLGIL